MFTKYVLDLVNQKESMNVYEFGDLRRLRPRSRRMFTLFGVFSGGTSVSYMLALCILIHNTIHYTKQKKNDCIVKPTLDLETLAILSPNRLNLADRHDRLFSPSPESTQK